MIFDVCSLRTGLLGGTHNSGELGIDGTKGLVIIGHSGDVEQKRRRSLNKLDTDKSGGLSVKEFEREYRKAISRRN
ncbi:MAG: hypothetical protein H6822_06120 [Planctomycetaceae bacterium]|nr:hypothetical protein [Planctomycetales bacterium]MCB9921737.1 hypothetical protein [Planctomycetaceae bacterium]